MVQSAIISIARCRAKEQLSEKPRNRSVRRPEVEPVEHVIERHTI